MKCENCGKNEVTFVYRSSVNGKVDEKHLCAECAEKLGYTRHLAASRNMMRNFFGNGGLLGGGFFGPFFGGNLLDGGEQSGGAEQSSGSLFDGFFALPALMGRMLDNPFDDFFADMPALGAAPEAERRDSLVEKEEESRFDRWRRLNALKAEMKKAVRKEEFERAAELRDQIREMEAERKERKD